MDLQKMKEFDLGEFFENFQGLDPENLGNWPAPVKLVILIMTFVAIIFGGYYFSIQSLNENLEQKVAREQTLVKEFEVKAFKAANLEEFTLQLAEMEENFKALLNQLPSDTEVPGLLEDISHTGLGSGLEFNSIKLGGESAKEFYIELPINLDVEGDYHSLGSFVGGVASLPRIVTLHDYILSPTKKGSSLLKMTITAKTYRYNDQEGG